LRLGLSTSAIGAMNSSAEGMGPITDHGCRNGAFASMQLSRDGFAVSAIRREAHAPLAAPGRARLIRDRIAEH